MKKILIINYDKKNYGVASKNLDLISNLLKINKFVVETININGDTQKNGPETIKYFFYTSYQ